MIFVKNRTKIDLISQILEAAKSDATRTKIMYRVFGSNDQVKAYLSEMIKNDLLVYEAKTHSYKTTKKGHGFLNLCHQLNMYVPHVTAAQARFGNYLHSDTPTLIPTSPSEQHVERK